MPATWPHGPRGGRGGHLRTAAGQTGTPRAKPQQGRSSIPTRPTRGECAWLHEAQQSLGDGFGLPPAMPRRATRREGWATSRRRGPESAARRCLLLLVGRESRGRAGRPPVRPDAQELPARKGTARGPQPAWGVAWEGTGSTLQSLLPEPLHPRAEPSPGRTDARAASIVALGFRATRSPSARTVLERAGS